MKKYIGVKTILAEPMTMGGAYEKHLLKVGKKPSEAEKDKAGYLVVYEGGYQSWSPKNVFEKAYQIAETPLDRMIIEYAEEFGRYKAGKKFIDSMNFDKLNYLTKILLSAQNESQRECGYLLYDRIAQMSNKPVNLTDYDFGTAIKFLKAGGAIHRAEWGSKRLFVVKQISANIKADVIPNMQSLPKIAKDILMKRDNPLIRYENQMLIIYPDGVADPWIPSSSDVFAEDWELVTE